MPLPGEENLIKELKSRNPEALTQVIHEHAAVLVRAALGLGFPEPQAQDLVQSVFTAFLEALDRFEGRSSVRTYLFGILYRKAHESWRFQSRELPTDPVDKIFEGRFAPSGHWNRPPRGPEDEALSEELTRLISQCLQGLNPVQRAAFHLKEVDREPGESICNILGVSDTHLRVLLFRARNRMRECLEETWKGKS